MTHSRLGVQTFTLLNEGRRLEMTHAETPAETHAETHAGIETQRLAHLPLSYLRLGSSRSQRPSPLQLHAGLRDVRCGHGPLRGRVRCLLE